MGQWVDVAPVLGLLRTWLDGLLPAAVTVVVDEAPEQLTGPTVVLTSTATPRYGPPLAGLDTLELGLLATSIAWDAEKRRSLPQQARALNDKVVGLIAGTTPAGGYLHAMALAGYQVLRREAPGDGRAAKEGTLWQVPEPFGLVVLANPGP